MDTTTLLDAARVAHFVGIALAFGLAMLADLTALRAVRKPIDEAMLAQLWRLHTLIVAGLALLWASGLTIIWLKTGFHLSEVTPKLTAKLITVVVLTGNALLMEQVALPVLRANVGRRIGEIAWGARAALGAIGGLSAACWAAALTLGGFTQLQTAAPADLALLLGVYGCAGLVAGVVLAAVAAPRLGGSAAMPGPEAALRRS